MAPPSSGPIAIPKPEPAPQIPIARARATGSATLVVKIASDAGRINGGPSACATRAAISSPGLVASAQASDPTENAVSPTGRALRRP
jgi:hypothetical protein